MQEIVTEQPPRAPLAPLAMISGGTRGIGLAIAKAFAHQGWDLSLAYLRQKKAARTASDELTAIGSQVWTGKCNVAEAGDVQNWIDGTREHFPSRPVRALILNAASGSLKPLLDTDNRGWEWTYRINVLGPLQCMRLAYPLLAPGSSIVALSSLGSRSAIPDYGLVGSSKAALEALVRQAAWEWGRAGIRVNGVAGGALPTGALNYFPQRQAILAASAAATALPEPLTAADLAAVIVWLCMPASRGIQGQTLIVDGGFSLGLPGSIPTGLSRVVPDQT